MMELEDKPERNDIYNLDNYDDDAMVLHKDYTDHQKIVDRLNMIEEKSWTAVVPESFADLSIA